jgi:hypothetical protein
MAAAHLMFLENPTPGEVFRPGGGGGEQRRLLKERGYFDEKDRLICPYMDGEDRPMNGAKNMV